MIQRIFTRSSLFIQHLLVTKPGIFHFFLWTKARTVEWELAIQQRKLFVKLGSWRHWEEKALMKLATVCANYQDFIYSSKEPWLRLFLYLLFTSQLLKYFAWCKRRKFVRNAILETGSFSFFPCNQSVAALNDPLTYFWFCTKPAPRHLWLIINQALEFTTSFSADPDPKEIPICLEFLKYKHCSCCLVRQQLPYATEEMFIFMFLEACNSARGR